MLKRKLIQVVMLLALAFTMGSCSWLQDEFFFVLYPGDAALVVDSATE